MELFYVDVQLRRGLTRVQVDEVPPESWDKPGSPQFVIEFYDAGRFLTLTIQLENGVWYDRNTRLSEDDIQLRYFELGPEDTWNPYYQSPLNAQELALIGRAINANMIVMLTAYLALFMRSCPSPMLN